MLDPMKRPTSKHISAILAQAGSARPVQPAWQTQRAPGSQIVLAENGRKIWHAFSGWTRVSLDQHRTDHGTLVRQVSLPDPWPRERTFDQAWYLLHPRLNPLPKKEHMWLRFDAIAHACVIFVNGEEAGSHIGGFTPFELDLTPWLQSGINTIAIWVQDDTAVLNRTAKSAISQLASPHRGSAATHRPEMAGLTGGVYLERRPPQHLTRIRIRPSTRKQQLGIIADLSVADTEGRIWHEVYDWPEGQTPVLTIPPTNLFPSSSGSDLMTVRSAVEWPNPTLWSPESPHLYVLRTTVEQGGRSESFETRFGFREFWIAGKRFMLNGHPIRLLGDGDVRFEFLSLDPERARNHNRKLLTFLKREFFFNAARLHTFLYPRWVVQAADEVGLLLINQSAIWSSFKHHYTRGGQPFLENMRRQFAEWFYRDANSPSVVIWDVENEMIRDGRTPEEEDWVLRLDDFIKRHDPDAIINHSGAAYYHPDQSIIHVHMQEQYARIMQEWQASDTIPLVMGEFWIGGRGETRLPNSYEYADREDWHREEARLYREHMLEMRNFGVAGVMPHRITHWPLRKPPTLTSADGESISYDWRFDTVRAEGARALAPVVAFAWPRSSTVVAEEAFTREVVVCNDREHAASLRVVCTYGSQTQQFAVSLAPGQQHRPAVSFMADMHGPLLAVAVHDDEAEGQVLEQDRLPIHALPQQSLDHPTMQRRLVVVPEIDDSTAAAFAALGLCYTVEDQLPADAAGSLVIVPPGARRDALGQTPLALRNYLHAGGRLLSLAQDESPAWLPSGLLFFSSVRSSVPEFDQSGWAQTNKDLIYSRFAPVYAESHPVFTDLAACDFEKWGEDGRVADDAFVRPHAAAMHAGCPYRVLLGHTRRENASLLEFRFGAGTGMLCQAQVMRQRHHPAARALFFNLLRYLDGLAWDAPHETLGLLGNLPPSQVARITGLAEPIIVDPADADQAPRVVLAVDGADVEKILALAQGGATVLVLSCETAARLPGFQVEQSLQDVYAGTRANTEDHPVFWGVASASFLPLAQSPACGVLSAVPKDAVPLLQGLVEKDLDWHDIGFAGLETLDHAPPLAVLHQIGQGCLIVTTLEPWNPQVESHAQLLSTLLANAGVPVPDVMQEGSIIQVKHTVPLTFDGRLDDWTNDMEDTNLSKYTHAVPMVLKAQDAVEGQVENDTDFSAVLYLLHDAEHLYAGGIAISSSPEIKLLLDVKGNLLEVDMQAETLMQNRAPVAEATLVFGEQTAEEVIDTRFLNLTRINWRTGKAECCSGIKGRTFEIAIPWSTLGCKEVPGQMQAVFRLARKSGEVLQFPAVTEEESSRVQLLLGKA